MKINYFDLGLFRDGLELEEVHRNILPKFNLKFNSYGIEANPEYFKKLQKKFYDENLSIFNLAICSENKPINLYLSRNRVGDSIYDTKRGVEKEKFFEVTGKKFSTFLKDNNIELDGNINICKINIEGAEWDFFNDIIDNNLLKHFHLFCGAGNDVYKIEEFQENGVTKKYNELLKNNNIKIYNFCMDFKVEKNINLQEKIKEIIDELSR